MPEKEQNGSREPGARATHGGGCRCNGKCANCPCQDKDHQAVKEA